MRQLRIFALGLIGLVAAVLISIFHDSFIIAAALFPLFLLVVGQFYLPHSRRNIQVWFNPIVFEIAGEEIPAEPGTPLARLSGKKLAYSYFKQWHEFEIVTHRFWLLAIIGLISLGAAGFAHWGEEFFFVRLRFTYIFGSVWITVLLLAISWFRERCMLRLKGLSIGSFSVYAHSRPLFQHVRYYFVDPQGEYRGGTVESMFCNQMDDITIVFYDDKNPDKSIPASALTFHKLIWKEPPVN